MKYRDYELISHYCPSNTASNTYFTGTPGWQLVEGIFEMPKMQPMPSTLSTLHPAQS